MPDISGSFTGTVTSEHNIHLPDAQGHILQLAEINGEQVSPDPDWVGSKLTYWGVADLTPVGGTQKGYYVNVHANGDRDFGTFEGTVTVNGTDVELQGSFKFGGGTGKFLGISGGGAYQGHAISPTELQMSWKGAYQLAAARAAGESA